MHVVLGILGSLITILILVNRLSDTGLDMGKLNPFAWARRKKWQEKYYADPAFSLDSPMEAAAGLMYVMAKCSGEISREQKQCILHLFQKEFKLNDRRATELLSSCSFLLKDEDKIVENLRDFMKSSFSKFDAGKKESTLRMLEKVATCEDDPSHKQLEFMSEIKLLFQEPATSENKW